ncbi:hypothetical protein IWQ60_009831, partial [Tieghemiomyces parasiticus]
FYKMDFIYRASLDEIHKQVDQLGLTRSQVEAERFKLTGQLSQLADRRAELEAALDARCEADKRLLGEDVDAAELTLDEKQMALEELAQHIIGTQKTAQAILDQHTQTQLVHYKETLHERLIDIVAELQSVADRALPTLDRTDVPVPVMEYDMVRIPHFRQLMLSRNKPFTGLMFLAAGIIWRLRIELVDRRAAELSMTVEMMKGRTFDRPAEYQGTIQLIHPDTAIHGLQRPFSGVYYQNVAHGVTDICRLDDLDEAGYYHSPDGSLLVRYGIRAASYVHKDQDQTQYIARLEQSLLKLKNQTMSPNGSSVFSPPQVSPTPTLAPVQPTPTSPTTNRGRVFSGSLPSPTFNFNFGMPASLGQVLATDPTSPLVNPFDVGGRGNLGAVLAQGHGDPVSSVADPAVIDAQEKQRSGREGDENEDWTFLDNSPHVSFPPIASPTEVKSFGFQFNPRALPDLMAEEDQPAAALGRRATTGLLPRPSMGNLGAAATVGSATSRDVSALARGLGTRLSIDSLNPPRLSESRRLSDVFLRSRLPSQSSSDFQGWLELRRRSGGKGAFSSAAFRSFHEAYDRERDTDSDKELAADRPTGLPGSDLGIPGTHRLVVRKSSPFPLNRTSPLKPMSPGSPSPPPPVTPPAPKSPVSSPRPGRLSPAFMSKPSPLRRHFSRSAHRKSLRSPSTSSTKAATSFYTPILMRSLRRPGDFDEMLRRQKEDPSFAAQLVRDHKSIFQRRVRRPLEGDPSDDETARSITTARTKAKPLSPTKLRSPATLFAVASTTVMAGTAPNRPAQSSNRTRISPARIKAKTGPWGRSGRPPVTSPPSGMAHSTPKTGPAAKSRSRATSLGSDSRHSPPRSTVPQSLAATLSPRGQRGAGMVSSATISSTMGKPPISFQLSNFFRSRGNSNAGSGIRSAGSTPLGNTADSSRPAILSTPGASPPHSAPQPRHNGYCSAVTVARPAASTSPLQHKSRPTDT